jgi:hypothetical protein
MITMPPLLDDDGRPESWYSVEFNNGLVSIKIVDELGGAYLVIETQEPWKLEAEELLAFAKWAQAVVDAMDKHNATT